MTSVTEELEKQLVKSEKMLQEVEKRLRTYKNLEPGNIRVAISHGCSQYYIKRPGKDKEEYVSAIEKEKVHLLAQRDYEEKVRKELIGMKNRLSKFIAGYDQNAIEHIYERMCDSRKQLVNPIVLTDEMYIEKWIEKYNGSENTYGEANEFKTQRGEYVRSKSEKIIADYFYSHNIPYQYEPRFAVSKYRNVFPDFVILNVRERKTIYWEHLGKVGEETYATRNFSKLMDYEEQGLIIGKNLIITMETEERPLDIAIVEEKVRLFA
ncbi:MAG: hypothetical protein IJU77_01605 [Butyrivibrio sp.]|nr:hypothetical protein [Butyrivibrio sp.]